MIWAVLLVVVVPSRSLAGKDTRFDSPDLLEPAPDGLQYAFIIFRHGIRTPLYSPFLNNEEYREKWPEGRGALTDAGKRLMFHVGESLKTRYQRHLAHYDANNVLVTSTPVCRTKLSAQCVAAGMFPASEPIIDDIPTWQPIPVQQNTNYDKSVIYGGAKGTNYCPRYVNLKKSVRAEEETWTLARRRKWFYKRVNKKLAKYHSLYNYVSSLTDIMKIWDSFEMDRLNLKPIPKWAEGYMKNMGLLSQLRMWSFIHGKTSMIQFYTGPMFHQILREMHEQGASSVEKDLDDEKVKLHLHGSHDIMLQAMFWTLAGQETYQAQPGDTLILELYKHEQIKLLLYSPLEVARDDRLQQISLKSLCAKDTCRLSEFKSSLKDLIFDEDEWHLKCNEDKSEPDHYRNWPQELSLQSLLKTLKNYTFVSKSASSFRLSFLGGLRRGRRC